MVAFKVYMNCLSYDSWNLYHSTYVIATVIREDVLGRESLRKLLKMLGKELLEDKKRD